MSHNGFQANHLLVSRLAEVNLAPGDVRIGIPLRVEPYYFRIEEFLRGRLRRVPSGVGHVASLENPS